MDLSEKSLFFAKKNSRSLPQTASARLTARTARLLICCLFGFTPGTLLFAQSVTLAWDPNPAPGIVGYRLYSGTSSGVYTQSTNVGNITSVSVSPLQTGKTYF